MALLKASSSDDEGRRRIEEGKEERKTERCAPPGEQREHDCVDATGRGCAIGGSIDGSQNLFF